MVKIYHFEKFEPSVQPGAPGLTSNLDESRSSDERADSQSYELGYQAGWDDAARTANEEQSSFSAEFSHNLQDIGFTFHEARSHVVRSMETLLSALADTLLPDVVANSVGLRILEEILPLAESAADRPIQILVSPDNRQLVEPLLSAHDGCPLELIEEPSLGPGQVFLRSGSLERKIDLDGAISKVKDAFDALAEDNKKVFAHG